jgi:sugar lactone lactonase YvrE
MPAAVITGVPGSVITTGFTANWNTVNGAIGYRLDVSTENSFSSFLTGYQDLDVGNITSKAISGLNAGTTYYYRVRAYDSAGVGASFNSATVTTTANIVISTPLTVSTLAGQPLTSGSADGTGGAARFYYPSGIAADTAGNLYLADTDNNTIRKIVASTGVVTTIAGLAGSSGNADGTGSAARFNNPSGVAVDGAGNIYVADTLNNTLRKVTAAGAVSTLAGQAGVSGGVDGSGTGAQFFGPQGLAIDASGNVLVADSNNHTIRKVVPSTGAVTTVAGLAGIVGIADGAGSAARFDFPSAVTLNGSGNLFVADTDNNTIRAISPAGVVSTLAGSAGYSGGADGTGSSARFNSPSDLAVDSSGNIYVADTDNFTIRKVVSSTGTVTTLAGLAGTSGSADGLGTAVRFYHPAGIAVDSSSSLYIADTDNHTLRLGLLAAAPAIQTQPQSQTVTAGGSAQFSVTASGRPAVTYQWSFNGTAISGATSSSYSLSSAQSANAGSYTVTVSNAVASVTSTAATLTVNAVTPPPSGDGGGGSGGGGGAPSEWFCGALLLLAVVRGWSHARSCEGRKPQLR